MASKYNPQKHDIGILRQDAVTNVGMMLAQERGVPQYAVFDDEYLARQYFTGTPGYDNLPAEKELAMRQDSWRGGIGLEVYNSDEPERYHQSRGADARFKNMVIAGPLRATVAMNTNAAASAGYPRQFIEFNNKLYIGAGKVLARLHDAETNWKPVNVFPINIQTLDSFTGSNMFIGFGALSSAAALVAGEGINYISGIFAGILKTVYTASPTLYASNTRDPNLAQVISSPEPENAASWSAPTKVGAGFQKITSLISKAGALYAGKEDMIYYLDSAGDVQNDLAPRLQAVTNVDSGKGAYTDGEKIWYPAGRQSLLEIDGTTLTWRTPGDYVTGLTYGRVAAVTADDMWLYAVVNAEASLHYVIAGRLETIGGSTKWVWHNIADIPLNKVETAFVSSIGTKKRLWVGGQQDNDAIYNIPLYDVYGDVQNDPNRSFVSNGYLDTPYLHANFKDIPKAFPSTTVQLGHAYNADVFVDVGYKKLGQSAFTRIGSVAGNADTREGTLYLPQDASSKNPISSMVQLRFTCNTSHTDLTPILRGYKLTGLLYPSRRKVIFCKVRCAQDMTLKDTTAAKAGFAEIEATIDEAVNASWPVTMYDLNGNVKYVKFLSLPAGTPRWSLVKAESGRKMERHYNLLLQEVTLS